nr:unnamed protein product [Callosobruchus chinensis]
MERLCKDPDCNPQGPTNQVLLDLPFPDPPATFSLVKGNEEVDEDDEPKSKKSKTNDKGKTPVKSNAKQNKK